MIEEYPLSPYEEGAAAWIAKEDTNNNPYRFSNNQDKFYEWELGWYKTAYELDNAARAKHSKTWHELSE